MKQKPFEPSSIIVNQKELRPMGKAIVELLHDRLPDGKPGARQNG
jgi:hypothetical protein